MALPRILRPADDAAPAPEGGSPRTGLAMLVVMAGVLMTAVDTTGT
jgi:hypothetical protein